MHILRTVFSMAFSRISGVFLLISSMMLFFNYSFLTTAIKYMPQLEDLNMQNLWFQQDGATPHTARDSMEKLSNKMKLKVKQMQ